MLCSEVLTYKRHLCSFCDESYKILFGSMLMSFKWLFFYHLSEAKYIYSLRPCITTLFSETDPTQLLFDSIPTILLLLHLCSNDCSCLLIVWNKQLYLELEACLYLYKFFFFLFSLLATSHVRFHL